MPIVIWPNGRSFRSPMPSRARASSSVRTSRKRRIPQPRLLEVALVLADDDPAADLDRTLDEQDQPESAVRSRSFSKDDKNRRIPRNTSWSRSPQ